MVPPRAKARKRKMALHLPREVEFELAVIQSSSTRDAWHEIREVKAKVTRAVEGAKKQPRKPSALLDIMPSAGMKMK